MKKYIIQQEINKYDYFYMSLIKSNLFYGASSYGTGFLNSCFDFTPFLYSRKEAKELLKTIDKIAIAKYNIITIEQYKLITN